MEKLSKEKKLKREKYFRYFLHIFFLFLLIKISYNVAYDLEEVTEEMQYYATNVLWFYLSIFWFYHQFIINRRNKK